MEVVWKAQALKDREEIHAFLARASLAHAYATIATIQRAINRLEQYPYLGKQVPHRLNERLMVVPRVSYSVLYRILARGPHPRIEIMRIINQRSQRR